MKKFVVLALLVISSLCFSQVSTKKMKPVDFDKHVKSRVKAETAQTFLPVLNIEEMIEEDLKDTSGLPFRFGKSIEVDLDLSSGNWEEVEDGRVWSLEIHSPGALSLNLMFDRFKLADGAELYVYNMQRDMVIGPITNEQNNKKERFATDVLRGETIILELFEPLKGIGKSKLSISKVTQGYRDISNFVGFGDSAPCHNDINCSEGNNWQDESDAVCMILLDDGQRWCSGSLLNNACQDFTPYILTAFHCIDLNYNGSLTGSEISDAEDWVMRFQYKSPTCNGSDPTHHYSFYGSTFRSAWNPTDFALLELDTQPLVAYTEIKYAGWTISSTPASSSAGIHHPRGDVMKISLDDDAAVATDWNGGANDHWRVVFDDGVVENGSSGSPLFNQNGLVVGQLHGRDGNVCLDEDNNNCFCQYGRAEYGRFDLSWTGGGTNATRLSTWLTNDPQITQVSTIEIPSISGPELLCTSGTYTLTNAPSTTVTWSVAPSNLVSPSSGTGTTANISKVGNGNAVITFTVGCGSPTDFGYSFHTGPYSSSDYEISGPSSAPCESYVYYTIPELAGVTSINWIWPSEWTYSAGQGTRYLDLITGDYSGVVMVRVNNTCGQGGSYDTHYTYVYGYCGGYYMAAPNPAGEYTVIDIVSEEAKAVEAKYDSDITLTVVDKMGMPVLKVNVESLPYILDTSTLPIGEYIIQIISEPKGKEPLVDAIKLIVSK